MSTIKNDKWPQIGSDLHNTYDDKDRYLTQQLFMRDHFLQTVTPYNETFFGTKVHNIIIVSKPYDWDSIEDSLNEAKELIKKHYHKWPDYHVWIYLDYILVNKVEGSSETGASSDYRSKMDDNETHIQDMCDEMSDFGFVYKGRLEDESIDQTYFFDQIDEFYARKE